MISWWRPILAVMLASALGAEDLAFEVAVAPAAQARLVVRSDLLAQASALKLSWSRDLPPGPRARADAYLDICLVTADERFFALAEPLPLDRATDAVRIPLDAAHWSGGDGSFGTDAVSALAHIRIRIHAPHERGSVRGTLAVEESSGRGGLSVALAAAGLVDRGPWRELRLRLVGSVDAERGNLDLVDGKRHWPLFLDQPATVDAGDWRAHGPARWTLRLRPDEQASGRLVWTYG
ncbi:MAG: hypothetical protein H0V44_02730, partial [Planctomycetes bacterium]|nr:hypothetical protein [Planctomycetota bacterium]